MRLRPSKKSQETSIGAAAVIAAGRTQLELALKEDVSRQELLNRYDRYAQDLYDGLSAVYAVDAMFPDLIRIITGVHRQRIPQLRHRDQMCTLQPDWFQQSTAIGYVAYADLFAKNLVGVRSKIDYLKELGVTYLHLMPLLTPRPGNNDGGYAVMDYRSVRSDLGTLEDFSRLAEDLHNNGISLTIDLVLNHVAAEHEWAVKAQAGDAKYRDYFYVYSDRTVPDELEKSLPEIFPTFAPGNFTFNSAMQAWVWTTFNEWQWDVNWSNPNVFMEYVDVIGFLANQGVDCLRLDAIAFIWKRMGTNCQNQPEVHSITQALRAAAHIMAPSLIFKAEAIVGPRDVVHYLGQGVHAGKVSDLTYHNSLMVQIWSALAARDGRLLSYALNNFAAIPTTSAWATYLRCHDDIGWAIDDADAAAIGISGPAHRSFLADYYANEFVGSFARGVHFQANAETGDRRTSGSAASLAGVEAALESGDKAELELAISRLIASYAIVFGFGGLPLLYMGDELGLINDRSFLDDPTKADDNRWIHRPAMNWDLVKNARNGKGAEGTILGAFKSLVRARQELASLHAATPTSISTAANGAVLIFRRVHAAGNLVEIFNLSETTHYVDSYGVFEENMYNHISQSEMSFYGLVPIPPYAAWWLSAKK